VCVLPPVVYRKVRVLPPVVYRRVRVLFVYFVFVYL